MLLSPWGHTVTAQSQCVNPTVRNGGTKPECLHKAAHLSTQVDYVGVGVIEGQQDSVTGVHLLNTYWLIHVFLETQNSVFGALDTKVLSCLIYCQWFLSPNCWRSVLVAPVLNTWHLQPLMNKNKSYSIHEKWLLLIRSGKVKSLCECYFEFNAPNWSWGVTASECREREWKFGLVGKNRK